MSEYNRNDFQIMKKWDTTRRLILNSLFNNPKNFSENLYKELETGIFNKVSQLISDFMIISDKNLSCFLSEIKFNTYVNSLCSDNLEVEILNEINFENFTQLIIKYNQQYIYTIIYNKISHPMIIYNNGDDVNFLRSKNINDTDELLNYDFLGSDMEYTNNILIGFILKSIYNKTEIINSNSIVKYYSGTISNINDVNLGITLVEYSNGGNIIEFINNSKIEDELNDINETENVNIFDNIIIETGNGELIQTYSVSYYNVLNIFFQVLANLDYLKTNYKFNHNNLTADNLMISTDINSSIFKYNNIIISTYYIIKLTNFHNSQISISIVDDRKLMLYGINNNIEISNLEYDTYTIMLSLILIPHIYYTVIHTEILKERIWNLLFVSESENIKCLKLVRRNLGRNNDLQTINLILKDINFKEGLTKLLLDNIKILLNNI